MTKKCTYHHPSDLVALFAPMFATDTLCKQVLLSVLVLHVLRVLHVFLFLNTSTSFSKDSSCPLHDMLIVHFILRRCLAGFLPLLPGINDCKILYIH